MANPIVWMMHPLAAPTAEGVAANLASAKRWLAWLYRHFPTVDFAAAWIPCCEAMDDANPEERARGLAFDCEMVRRLDGVWMAGGRVSSGMERERAVAIEAGKPVVDLTFLGADPPPVVYDKINPIRDALAAGGYRWSTFVTRGELIRLYADQAAWEAGHAR